MVLEGSWNWSCISEYIPISEVYKYPYETWNRWGLSWNKGITIDLVHNLVLPNAIDDWNYYSISKNRSILDAYKYPDDIWSRSGLSENKDITIDDIYSQYQ